MYDVKKINEDLYWIGANDRRITLFENIFPVKEGVSYNSYILLDEKTVVFDTVDNSVNERFLENIAYTLNGRDLDYLIVNHLEPDHCGTIETLIAKYKGIKIVCNAKAKAMAEQYFSSINPDDFHVIKEGDELSVGRHVLTFIMAPMLHWPEVMVTYDKTSKTLFSADAFGTFGALAGRIFADEYNFETDFLDSMRRYYSNIVGKYGAQAQALLKKSTSLEINLICPLHGPIWRDNLELLLDKHQKWSTYTPEERGVVIAYASAYGNTQNAIEILAGELCTNGFKTVKIFDVSSTDTSYIVSEIFKYSHIVFAAPTYNGAIFQAMETLLHDLKLLNVQNRVVALIENGSWGPTSAKQMETIIGTMKDMTIIDEKVTIKATLKENQLDDIINIAKALSSNKIINS